MQSKLLRIVALLLALSLHGFAAAQDLLQPDVAFKFSAHALDANTLEVRYKIADGYYLYRDKFKFTAEPATVKLGTAQFPQGDVHNDEFFGKVETYRKESAYPPAAHARCVYQQAQAHGHLPGLR